MRKKIKKSLIFSLSILAVAAGTSSVAIFQSKALEYIPELVEPVTLEEVYSVGEKITVPSASIQYGNQEKVATAIVHYPNNRSYAQNEIILSIPGAYSIEYQAKFNDSVQSVFETFYAFNEAYALSSGKQSTYFGNNKKDSTAYGLNMEVSRNEVLRYAYPIDLNDFDKETPVVSIRVLPEMDGVYDFTELYVRFVDAYDSSNYVTTKIHNNFKVYSDQSWQLVGAANQPFKGRDWQRHDQRLFTEDFGTVVGCTLNGAKNPAYGANNCEGYWDYEERQVFGALDLRKPGANNMIADLDDLEYFDNLWDGFTTGEVFVEIWTDQNTSVGNLCVQKIGDWDLSKEYLDEREVLPTIDIEYDLAQLPVGAVGKHYKLFDATANDLFTKDVTIIKKVYKNYGTSSQVEIALNNGYFIPQQSGVYTIEYTAVNRALGKTVKSIDVLVESEARALALSEIIPTEKTALVGLPIDLAEYSIVAEGNGNAKVLISVKHIASGETYFPEEKNGLYSFTPKKVGQYEVKYELTDYIGQTDSFSYDVQAVLNDGAVVDIKPILPKYFIEGEKYILPSHYAKKYNANGNYEEVLCDISVIDANGTTTLGKNGHYIPKGNADIKEATVIYSAGEGSFAYRQKIEILNVNHSDGKLDLSAYFKTNDGMSVVADRENKSNIVFTANENGANAKFINKLLAEQFSFRFAPNVDGDVGRIDIILTDVYNEEKQIKFSFFRYNDAQKCEFSVNDGRRYILSVPFSSADLTDTIFFQFSSSSSNLTVNNDAFSLYLSENPLKDTKEVYFEFVVNEVTRPSGIRVDRLCGQIFSGSTTVDRFSPMIALDSEMDKRVIIGTQLNLATARSLDVLSPTTTLLVTVYGPDGNIVTDITTGKEIKDADPNIIYKIACDKLGEYSIQYVAADSNGKVTPWSYAIRVIENNPPQITLKEAMPTAVKVGDYVKISQVDIVDDVDVATQSYICIMLPNGALIPVDISMNDGFFAMDIGTYIVMYMAWDSTGNYNIVSHEIAVK